MLKIMGFPSRYVQGPGALAEVGRFLRELQLERPVILCDETVRAAVVPILAESLQQCGLQVGLVNFPGQISQETLTSCKADIGQHRADVVLGLGGGKAIDAAKAAAVHEGLPIIVVPTIASNDAPTSRLIVINDRENKPTSIEYLKLNPLAVFVDTEVIVRAPPRFFAAGIGDAVSKSLEAHQCAASNGQNFFGTPPTTTALMMSDHCYEIILQSAASAYRSVCDRKVSTEVEKLVEATVLLSGIGFESGGLSLAHALIRGITSVPSTSNMLHGEMVAFGAFTQMVVEERSTEEIERLLKVLVEVRLPVTFEQLGGDRPQFKENIGRMVDATLAHSYAKNMHPALTHATLSRALERADAVGQEYVRDAHVRRNANAEFKVPLD
ncbi:glycerol dehydrogenase [Hoeflea prorocentri]|uniref:Glycerol dehydrogenase n=1 Tax=Hoeflea prorocentri TaxID=1922333 RepID=A0A9X3ZHI7_9HYPH|nr:glycerol dehydrogenase [Hoeflea prorocentri]MCY6381882.1 glycerol dehydrogenase [Hoeflea prorocentri]MDA5399682.1 glycerol dehydrogenase [Hoeflea prorocentri]